MSDTNEQNLSIRSAHDESAELNSHIAALPQELQDEILKFTVAIEPTTVEISKSYKPPCSDVAESVCEARITVDDSDGGRRELWVSLREAAALIRCSFALYRGKLTFDRRNQWSMICWGWNKLKGSRRSNVGVSGSKQLA
ncbi:hypothetical protein CERZMDRAFT_92983 [Cercospora zeae-maydis SCOH1-5]|uniref:Uncharacterized protein n=1 Tax=Cercospora zeae-maydis SCOH1-5 TaxID=717836 RepID=A0A6A6FTU5_9PEZI|nr:hypothetical protein CERZMDRAFT_92983 [Cercospora zeae-maydis SCOH1-5]